MSGREVLIRFETRADFELCLCDLSIDTSAVGGEVRLAPSVLVADEIGDGIWKTSLSDCVRAKKLFLIDLPGAQWAQVLTFGDPARISVNGREVASIVHQEDGGWYCGNFPAEWLWAGVNEVVMWGGGEIWIEPSWQPNRSAASWNGGRTWDDAHLNVEQTLDGEYMARLRLGHHPRSGALTSPPIDLAELASDGPVSQRIRVNALRLDIDAGTPRETELVWAVRGGWAPSYTPQTWSRWCDPQRLHEVFPVERLRYVQWQACLSSRDAAVSPVIRGVTLAAQVEFEPSGPGTIEVVDFRNETIVRGGIAFRYQPPSEKLTLLRSRCPLDLVVSAGETELEQLILLRDWVKRQWKGWEGDRNRAWDAIDILSAPVGDRGMCVQFAIVFVQCALALGHNARAVILNHHFIAEVWSNDLKKWVCMDAGPSGGVKGNRNMHFENDGVVLNTLEVHEAWKAGSLDEVQLVPTNPDDCGPMGDWGKIFCRFFVPMRNNHLDAPRPAETGHGCTQYHYDGYLVWENDPARLRSPEYSMQTSRPRDLYWTLNQAQLHLQRGADAADLLVQATTVTPNFKIFSVRIDGGDWVDRDAQFVWRHLYEDHDRRFSDALPHEAVERSGEFVWRLHEGKNTLEVKPVNAFDIEGITSRVVVRWGGKREERKERREERKREGNTEFGGKATEVR